jgi:microcystin-dependent protein
MSNPFLGEIRIGGWNFAPFGHAQCNGQLVSIAAESALFALLGTTYGGDGVTTFALPDLRGRSVWGMGTGPGLSTYIQGQTLGAEQVTLLTSQLPVHTHAANAVAGPGVSGATTTPTNKVWNSQANAADPPYEAPPSTTPMAPAAVGAAGSGLPHNNLQPLLALNFVIAMIGVFPARN